MSDMFIGKDNQNTRNANFIPLAERLRPSDIEEFHGQEHLTDIGTPIRTAIDENKIHSMVLWGPPGTGKTTLAKLISSSLQANLISLSAVMAGVADIRSAVKNAQNERIASGMTTVVFLDEIHRFNKSQQDAFLPYLEDGTITLIGATTENPSFQLNNALLSRLSVYIFNKLDELSLKKIINNALTKDFGENKNKFTIDENSLDMITAAADGDARYALNIIELVITYIMTFEITPKEIKCEYVKKIIGAKVRNFDNKGEYFYDQISALHKSIRGSDPDAALYWLMRMIDGGCDVLYLARRLIRVASEDIGNADPRALRISLDAWECWERLGSPEGELAIAQATIYLACAPKSNAVYKAVKTAMSDVQSLGSMPVPKKLRNAPSKLMKEIGYGENYRYAHDEKDGIAYGEKYFPNDMEPRKYYHPVDRGLEIKIKDKLMRIKEIAQGNS
tara:strand:- start:668 stop:2011 length:1344 start_codon:yes stop_codon:yes gene_type:complete